MRCRGPVNRVLMMRTRGFRGPVMQHIGGGVCARSNSNFVDGGGPIKGATWIVPNAAPNTIVITLDDSRTFTATTAGCGWRYSVNGGAYVAVSGGLISPGNVLTLTMVAPVIKGDIVAATYGPINCDLKVDGVPVPDLTQKAIENQVL